MLYTLTIIRLKKEGLKFQNTESNSILPIDPFVKLLLSSGFDSNQLESVNKMGIGDSKTLECEFSLFENDYIRFAYIHRIN